jgi:hypothetical protein
LITITLYSTEGCHLCEEAEALLSALPNHLEVAVAVTDIMLCEDHLNAYRTRIPVLHIAPNNELDWPFNLEQLQKFIENIN